MVNKKILILTSGKVSKLDAFKNKGVDLGSFNDINYSFESNDLRFKIYDLRKFDLIYFRMVGKSLEVATLVTKYALDFNIKIIDKLYTNSLLLPMSLGKSIETYILQKAGIPMPKTVFGDFTKLPFPFVIKSTTSSRAREVWLVNNKEELEKLALPKNKFFVSQELIPNAHRVRALVIGDKVVGAIKRQTKWNKDDTKITLNPVPEGTMKLAIEATKAVNLDICGVDILINSKTNEMFVIEANAAPSWKLINKYCAVSVEDEIIKYLQTKI